MVNSSRGVLFPFRPEEADWEARIETAARQAAAALAGLIYTHLWERTQSHAYVEMQKTYDRTVALLRSARELELSRDALAAPAEWSRK